MHYFQLVVIPLRLFHMDIRFYNSSRYICKVLYSLLADVGYFPLTKDRALDTYIEYFWYKAISFGFLKGYNRDFIF